MIEEEQGDKKCLSEECESSRREMNVRSDMRKVKKEENIIKNDP